MIETVITGVEMQTLTKHRDDRGWLMELWRNDALSRDDWPAMGYLSCTLPGVIRGPHEHLNQTDHFVFLGPAPVEVYLWENRTRQPNYRELVRLPLDLTIQSISLSVPPGVVHAYRNIGDQETLIFNAPNRLYAGRGRSEAVDEIRWEGLAESPFVVPQEEAS